MTAPVKYRERQSMDDQPLCEVEVFSPTTWGGRQGYPDYHVVRYPDCSGLGIPGREYIVTTAQRDLHFEMVLPQTLRVQAWGGVFERPMQAQRELEEAEALAAQLDPDTEPEASDG